jgi:hypothetical protein
MDSQTGEWPRTLRDAVRTFVRSHYNLDESKPNPLNDFPELKGRHEEPMMVILKQMRLLSSWSRDFDSPVDKEQSATIVETARRFEELNSSIQAIDRAYNREEIIDSFSKTTKSFFAAHGECYTPHEDLPNAAALLETGRRIITEFETQYPQILQKADRLDSETVGRLTGRSSSPHAKDCAAAKEAIAFLLPAATKISEAASRLKESLGDKLWAKQESRAQTR